MKPQKSPGKILLASGGLAVLLLAGAGCLSASAPAPTPAPTPAPPSIPAPAPTPAPNGTDCVEDGEPVKCALLFVTVEDQISLTEQADLERALVAQGVQVKPYVPTPWHLTIPSTTSSELGAWEEKISDAKRGFVYFDGSKLSMVPAPYSLTSEDERKAKQLPGYVGEFVRDVFGPSFKPKEGFDQIADAVLQAFVAEGVQVGRVNTPTRTIILPADTTSDELRRWHDQLLEVLNVARVNYVSALPAYND